MTWSDRVAVCGMDPFTQRIVKTAKEKILTKRDNELINIWSLPSEEIMDIGIKQSRMVGNQFEVNNNMDEELNLETEIVLNNFLHDALGSTSSLSSEHCNTSGYSSETQKVDPNSSEGITAERAQEPLHYTVHGYRAMIKKKKIKFRSPLLTSTFNVKELKKDEIKDKQNLVITLEENLLSEKAILQQTTKALRFCRTEAKLCFSSQHAEWERQLLFSIHKYFAIAKKLECTKSDILSGCPLHCESGKIQISNILLNFESTRTFQNDSDTWYVCLFSNDEDIKVTELIPVSKNQKEIFMKELFTFNNLLNDFTIKVRVFSLRLKPYKKKILRNPFKNFQHDNGKTSVHDSSMENVFKAPDFQLEGYLDMRLENLKSTVQSNFAQGYVKFHLTWEMELKVNLSGFLSLRKNIGEYNIWERKWCLLEGNIFKYWNDPLDAEKLPPLEIINLQDCITSRVSPLDEEFDPWHKIFVLKTKVSISLNCNNFILKQFESQEHFFRADTTKELLDWCMALNKHIEIMTKWKVMNYF